ncbi:hypothetical protein GCM10029976_083680 [Kribbella albertanoniae]|uniref:NmrA/HSCARG family protein n=1 Tax=Kribbella albertanoniae TaxID=1266829 RepID=A0A4R4PSC1_9ACTN|nr:NmrA/HSCARG family protein [Kribbella albertanoniae]TDC25184.1 NmrA/HSCARG family protein [Kribbella albertanoniae]
MTVESAGPVLVTGATGRQGGATARALLAVGVPVRALVRDPARAREVEALGAELVVGDLGDRDSVLAAAKGVRAVFSVQMPPFNGSGFDFAAEVAQGINLVDAAREAGVPQFVHTSVSGAGQHVEAPGWADGRWSEMEATLNAKAAIQDHVRTAGFADWTILKPAFFMENFLPELKFLFPRGIDGGLVSVIKPSTKVSLIATDDIGRAAAAAIADPSRFHAVELELAGDYLSMAEIAKTMAEVLDVPLEAPDLTESQALAAGMPPMGATHEWLNAIGQPARPEYARSLDLPLTSFRTWARDHLLS